MTMYYTYILKDKNNKLYIGYSSNLKRRIKEHLRNKVFTTKKMDSPQLFYYESYSNKEMAKEREKKLKQFGSSYTGLLKRIGLK
jgi:putative endonuclease